MKIEKAKVADLIPDPENANAGTEYGQALLEESIRDLGLGRSVLVDRNNILIAGNKTHETAGALGLENALIVETDGSQLVVVRRTDLDLREDEGGEARRMSYADNRVGQLNLSFDSEQLLEHYRRGLDLKPFWTDAEMKRIEDGPQSIPPPDDDERPNTTHTCPKCGHEWS
jgi:hypothetical protein